MKDIDFGETRPRIVQATDRTLIITFPSAVETTDEIKLRFFTVQGQYVATLGKPQIELEPETSQAKVSFRKEDTAKWFSESSTALGVQTLHAVWLHTTAADVERAWSGRCQLTVEFEVTYARGARFE